MGPYFTEITGKALTSKFILKTLFNLQHFYFGHIDQWMGVDTLKGEGSRHNFILKIC